MSVIPTLGRMRQKDHEFEVGLHGISRHCPIKPQKTKYKKIPTTEQKTHDFQ
jgi:hypothetical protein